MDVFTGLVTLDSGENEVFVPFIPDVLFIDTGGKYPNSPSSAKTGSGVVKIADLTQWCRAAHSGSSNQRDKIEPTANDRCVLIIDGSGNNVVAAELTDTDDVNNILTFYAYVADTDYPIGITGLKQT